MARCFTDDNHKHDPAEAPDADAELSYEAARAFADAVKALERLRDAMPVHRGATAWGAINRIIDDVLEVEDAALEDEVEQARRDRAMGEH